MVNRMDEFDPQLSRVMGALTDVDADIQFELFLKK